MSSSWFWFWMGFASLILTIVAASYSEFFSNRHKVAPKVLCDATAVLLVVLMVTSFGLTIYNRNDHRRASLKAELQQKGFANIDITSINEDSDAEVDLPEYPGGCRLNLYKQGPWLFELGDMKRSVTTAEDMATWPSVKFACNKNPR